MAARLGVMAWEAIPDAAASDGMTVGAVASRLGVTIRTLHHWDAIGLAGPSERTTAGYRLYTPSDLGRLHRVLIYRELEVPLDEIASLLDAPSADATDSLVRQREQLEARIATLQRMGSALDRLIDARRSGILLTDAEQLSVFGEHWQPTWTELARRRWGDTAQWAQYTERSAARTPQDWREIAAAVDELHAALAAASVSGVVPGSAEANALAERHRASIGTYFDCTHSMHVCIGRRYDEDPEFRANFERIQPGLTTWLRACIDANARANGVDPETAVWQ